MYKNFLNYWQKKRKGLSAYGKGNGNNSMKELVKMAID